MWFLLTIIRVDFQVHPLCEEENFGGSADRFAFNNRLLLTTKVANRAVYSFDGSNTTNPRRGL